MKQTRLKTNACNPLRNSRHRHHGDEVQVPAQIYLAIGEPPNVIGLTVVPDLKSAWAIQRALEAKQVKSKVLAGASRKQVLELYPELTPRKDLLVEDVQKMFEAEIMAAKSEEKKA